MREELEMHPVLKWAGGKRQLIDEITARMPSEYKRYYEPFIGGAALLFHLKPERAVINDSNSELINLYLSIKRDPEKIIECLKAHKRNHCSDHYYNVRSEDREESFSNKEDYEKAARTIYLNHTCFNGLYRVNKKGYFNTPIGNYSNPSIFDEDNILSISEYFNSNEIIILNGDYTSAIKDAKSKDFVYLDPPYDPVSSTSSFTAYTSEGFGKDDQEKLKETCDKLTSKGVKFIQSNSNTQFIRDLYKEYTIDVVQANRAINTNANNRTGMEEVLVYNY